MTTQAQIIESLKAFALANYDKGYDVFVECYDQAEWVELLVDCNNSEAETLALMANMAEVYNERYAEARTYQEEAESEYTSNAMYR